MKRNIAKAAVLAVVMAVVVPASASAVGVYPAGHTFSVTGPGSPQIRASLPGTCTLTPLSGSIPAAPGNVNTMTGAFTKITLPLASPTASCSGGASATISPAGWALAAHNRYAVKLSIPANGLTLRYTTLPGCKLANAAAAVVTGVWTNGIATPTFSKSIWGPRGTYTGTWANDGATCAVVGQTEAVTVTGSLPTLWGAWVNDITSAADLIQLTTH